MRRLFICLFMLIALAATPSLLCAQSNSGPQYYPEGNEVEPPEPHLPEEMAGTLAMLRVWVFTPPEGESIDVFAFSSNGNTPQRPAVGVHRSHIGRYQPSPSGQVQLYVVPEQSTSTETPAAESDLRELNLLESPIEIQINAGSYATLILECSEEGVWTHSLLDDSNPDQRSKLRLFNFSGQPDINLALLEEGNFRSWLTGPIPSFKSTDLPQGGRKAFVVDFPLKKGLRGSRTIEMNVDRAHSCSLIVCRDRYGRMAVRFTKDAPPQP